MGEMSSQLGTFNTSNGTKKIFMMDDPDRDILDNVDTQNWSSSCDESYTPTKMIVPFYISSHLSLKPIICRSFDHEQ